MTHVGGVVNKSFLKVLMRGAGNRYSMLNCYRRSNKDGERKSREGARGRVRRVYSEARWYWLGISRDEQVKQMTTV